MNYQRLLCYTLPLLLLTSCQQEEEGCPDRTDLGFFTLEPVSFGFVPYDTEDTLVYRNEADEEIRFFHAFDNFGTRYTHLLGALTCTSTSEEISEVQLDGEMLERWYVTLNGLQIRYFLRVQPLLHPPGLTVANAPDWKGFYDVLTCQIFRRSLGVEELDENCAFSIITDYRQGPPLSEQYQWMNDHHFFSEVTVGGRTIQRAYAPSDCATYPDLYYTQEQGVVSFRDVDGQLWMLDRVE